ncbi:hypothetical protein GIB67_022650 [Kingdonia uniflora]|uniref:Uncharacterized protein n=1 Tax=Kingdonia uniflora TaxID=39325 RepID=A0A7J7P8Y6_9MAGN|nr:hypothetical protein GIB67_022650 [Kingdonia uniflora]
MKKPILELTQYHFMEQHIETQCDLDQTHYSISSKTDKGFDHKHMLVSLKINGQP